MSIRHPPRFGFAPSFEDVKGPAFILTPLWARDANSRRQGAKFTVALWLHHDGVCRTASLGLKDKSDLILDACLLHTTSDHCYFKYSSIYKFKHYNNIIIFIYKNERFWHLLLS